MALTPAQMAKVKAIMASPRYKSAKASMKPSLLSGVLGPVTASGGGQVKSAHRLAAGRKALAAYNAQLAADTAAKVPAAVAAYNANPTKATALAVAKVSNQAIMANAAANKKYTGDQLQTVNTAPKTPAIQGAATAGAQVAKDAITKGLIQPVGKDWTDYLAPVIQAGIASAFTLGAAGLAGGALGVAGTGAGSTLGSVAGAASGAGVGGGAAMGAAGGLAGSLASGGMAGQSGTDLLKTGLTGAATGAIGGAAAGAAGQPAAAATPPPTNVVGPQIQPTNFAAGITDPNMVAAINQPNAIQQAAQQATSLPSNPLLSGLTAAPTPLDAIIGNAITNAPQLNTAPASAFGLTPPQVQAATSAPASLVTAPATLPQIPQIDVAQATGLPQQSLTPPVGSTVADVMNAGISGSPLPTPGQQAVNNVILQDPTLNNPAAAQFGLTPQQLANNTSLAANISNPMNSAQLAANANNTLTAPIKAVSPALATPTGGGTQPTGGGLDLMQMLMDNLAPQQAPQQVPQQPSFGVSPMAAAMGPQGTNMADYMGGANDPSNLTQQAAGGVGSFGNLGLGVDPNKNIFA